MVRLVMALYGHPTAGNNWQGSNKKRILSLEWQCISQTDWVDCYEHPETDASLTCYVDDYTLVCKPKDAVSLASAPSSTTGDTLVAT